MHEADLASTCEYRSLCIGKVEGRFMQWNGRYTIHWPLYM